MTTRNDAANRTPAERSGQSIPRSLAASEVRSTIAGAQLPLGLAFPH